MTTLDTSLLTQLNTYGATRRPFLLLVDFEQEQPQLWPLDQLPADEIQLDFPAWRNTESPTEAKVAALQWAPHYPSAERYQAAFQTVQAGLQRGDSFLLNLTFPTDIVTNWNLRTIFEQTQARYRLWWRDHFTVFSPETFVKIRDHKIYSYPMKGTLGRHLPGELLLQNPKEIAEHATIVDLIRNDLSQIASRVRVEKYRYLETINTAQGGLWQTSTRIAGQLPIGYQNRLGDLLAWLLPAGSISGAPKPATLGIIQEAEGQKRGFYTGVAVLCDGQQLDSCVLIRLVEQTATGLRYWSGGGITAYSDWQEEYQELKEKVYLPVKTAVLA
ncbi:MAG: aminodeoxychorismate synthase component I [Bacteroidota bacterium]